MLGQPRRHRIGDGSQLRLRREFPLDELQPRGSVRRIGLGVARRRRQDVRGCKGLPHLRHRMSVPAPVDEVVGEIDDALHGAPGVGQIPRRHPFLFHEVPEEVRAGGGESLVDGLIGVPHPHPVTLRPGEQAQNGLL